ncbi:GNAT family N-acetyltransferase [Kribbella sp. NPDC051620]|uniref:bifunctional acetate--CoA ligase family protein/GNAT family N-acetyltransferase n=1 Tax=Kribbella sp. NPDC051620 TaxID=3364120 RepID=UPI0037A217A6
MNTLGHLEAPGPGDAPPRPAAAGWDALATDGSVVHLRPIARDDEPALKAINHRVSDRSIYLRFFGVSRLAADEHTRHLVDSDPADRQVALVAEVDGAVAGVASYELISAGEAEMAFLVDDSMHGRGLGTLLLEQLAAVARERGVKTLRAETLAENAPMLRVFLGSGFREVHRFEEGVVELSLDTAYDALTLDRMAERESAAESRSLRPVLSPRSVAVIGAGGKLGGIGPEVLLNLVDGGFSGDLYAVHPNTDRIGDVTVFPSIADVPGPVDLAVIAVPVGQVRGVVEQCGLAGVGGAVILTSGFPELGPDGRQELLALARRHSLRLIGPNCLGVVNTDPEVRLDATFANARPEPGGLALAAQSGAVGIAVLDHAGRIGPGVSEFVSLGDKADVSGNDLLLHWWNDPRTDVIGLYLESFGNPRKFGRLARLVGRKKPVLVVKGGRSTGGRRARASHPAAAATPDTAVDALFEQSGVLRMETLEELIDTARVLSGRPLPKGPRLAIVGNAGGAGVLAADAAAAAGLEVPEFSPATMNALAGAVGPANPVDLGAAATPQTLEHAIRIILASGEVDAVLVTYAATRGGHVDDTYAAIARATADATVPVLVNCLGAPKAPTQVVLENGSKLPVYAFPETAVRALGHAVRYAAWRARPQGVVPEVTGVDKDAARAVARRYLNSHPTGGWLDPAYAEQLMVCAGIPVVDQAPTGVELLAGLVRDPLFGPVLMIGGGGVLTDLLADRRWRGLPLTDLDAMDMVRSLRCAAGADEPAVLEVLHRLAWLAEAVPELAELDINPLTATPTGVLAANVKVRLTPAPPDPDCYSRHLGNEGGIRCFVASGI